MLISQLVGLLTATGGSHGASSGPAPLAGPAAMREHPGATPRGGITAGDIPTATGRPLARME